MCCTPVSGHTVVMYFGVEGSRQDRSPKWASGGVGEDKVQLGLADVNLQTEELHCNYTVLIGNLE